MNNFFNKPNAKIKNARIEQWGESQVIVGFCTEHEGRPELVNRTIHTSRVLEINGNLAETKNTRYLVEWLP